MVGMRPKLLWEAAGHLVRLTEGKMKTRSLEVVLAEEREMNDVRLSGRGDYRPRRHLELLGEYLTIRQKEQQRCT